MKGRRWRGPDCFGRFGCHRRFAGTRPRNLPSLRQNILETLAAQRLSGRIFFIYTRNNIFRRADRSGRENEQAESMLKIQQIFDDSSQRYGAEKIRIILADNGVHLGKGSILCCSQKEKAHRRDYASEEGFQKSIQRFVELYNGMHPHRTLKYQTPQGFEDAYFASKREAYMRNCCSYNGTGQNNGYGILK